MGFIRNGRPKRDTGPNGGVEKGERDGRGGKTSAHVEGEPFLIVFSRVSVATRSSHDPGEALSGCQGEHGW
jgi:hypothetical protein